MTLQRNYNCPASLMVAQAPDQAVAQQALEGAMAVVITALANYNITAACPVTIQVESEQGQYVFDLQ